jgi:multicomponent Na+:H+ antiporter subunit C
MAIVIGGLYAAGLYMMLARSIVKLVFGLVLMSHAANLLIFTVSGLVRAAPPLVAVGDKRLTGPYADPLPQALVLTAIVISFAVLAFTAVLVKRVYATTGTDDSDKLRTTDT